MYMGTMQTRSEYVPKILNMDQTRMDIRTPSLSRTEPKTLHIKSNEKS